MKETILKLEKFYKEFQSISKGINIKPIDFEAIEAFNANKTDDFLPNFERVLNKIKTKLDIDFPEDQKDFYYATSCGFRWSRSEIKSEEGFLSGGFFINGLMDIFLYELDFWSETLENFELVNQNDKADTPDKLRWFESPSPANSSSYTPHYGCLKLEKGKFPTELFFYDSGILYNLPFKNIEEYLNAMMASGGVHCWQYFYIEPKLIIEKNKGVSYFTWPLHSNTNLDNDLQSLALKEDAKFDRLDLIMEHLERCVKLLPSSFSFLDFKYHEKQLKKIKKLYK